MSDYFFTIAGETIRLSTELLNKYNKIGPRYTSYPTAPEWSTDFSFQDWQEALQSSNETAGPVSLYFHIPFCQSACYYCACNFVVSPHNQLSEPYLEALKREIRFLGSQVNRNRRVKQIHLGGGTPTYLSASQIISLLDQVKANFEVDQSDESELSIEVDPRVTTSTQLQELYLAGFNRVSLGVQDFNPDVQKAVNRIQSYAMVRDLLQSCRSMGYQSINFDLIYGLPHQNTKTFRQTIEQVLELSPDRIALFSYAHLPSLRPFQKAHIDEDALPKPETKLQLFAEALSQLSAAGYEYVGMDHFAKPTDELCRARNNRTLHRNFQGYTTQAGLDLYGIGMTSISSFGGAYTQNEKRLNRYMEFFGEAHSGGLLLEKGCRLKSDDFVRREIINRLLCHGLLNFQDLEAKFSLRFRDYFRAELDSLSELIEDGLVCIDSKQIRVTLLGRIFLRNIAMVFDFYLRHHQNRLFSRTV